MSRTPTPAALVAPSAPTATPLPADRPVRWGFLTAARIANKWARALNHLAGEAELVAVASRSLDKGTAFAREHGVTKVLDDYQALVERDDIDIIYVASPHSHHLDHALLALRAGKPVLVEKPATPTLDETRVLIDEAAQRGLFLMEAMWTRCNPLIRQAQDLIARGVLGSPRLLTANFPVKFTAPDEHRIFNPALAGGAVLDLGVYPMHVAQALLGRPTDISAQGSLTRTGVDNTSIVTLRWDDRHGSTHGAIATTLDGRGIQRLELTGTLGSLVIPDFVKPQSMTFVPNEGEAQEFVTAIPGEGYTFQAQEVHRCLRLGQTQSALVPWQASLDVAAALEQWITAVHHSPAPTPPTPNSGGQS